jgi:hypothetical protein
MPVCPSPGNPAATLDGWWECSSFTAPGGDTLAFPSLDCVEYTYSADATLSLRHINAGFNCCPGDIAATIEVDGSLISIVESEAEQGCRCDCLFGLGYRIQDLSPGIYRIHVWEPCARPEWGDLPPDFVVDLTVPISDTLCVVRTCPRWDLH